MVGVARRDLKVKAIPTSVSIFCASTSCSVCLFLEYCCGVKEVIFARGKRQTSYQTFFERGMPDRFAPKPIFFRSPNVNMVVSGPQTQVTKAGEEF